MLTVPVQNWQRQHNRVDKLVLKGNDDPCAQAKSFVEKATNLSKTEVYQTALVVIQNKVAVNPACEYAIGFGKDAQGNVISSDISTGGRSSGRIPAVLNAFADLHNHPDNTPPSSGDLYGLIRKNRINTNYDTRYVMTQGKEVYVFVVTDTVSAQTFLLKYPPQQIAGYSPLFPDELLNEYREIQQKHNATEEMAMAYVLEKYDVGVSLLKQDKNGDFKKLRTLVLDVNSELIFSSNNCE